MTIFHGEPYGRSWEHGLSKQVTELGSLLHLAISTIRFSILINGEASGFFSSSRGLHQGDTLSPLLCILVMETLSKLVNKACEVSLLKDFHVGNSQSHGFLVSYLFFVNLLRVTWVIWDAFSCYLKPWHGLELTCQKVHLYRLGRFLIFIIWQAS